MQASADTQPHSTRKFAPWQGHALAAALLLALTVIYFWRQVVEGQALYWGDIGLYFTPMAGFLKQNLNAGRLPLWNPLILCGTPYIGNPQTWPLYPVTALLPFVSATQFENLTIALHILLAGFGTYLFARRALGVGTGPALLAAVTFMFGGQLVSKEQFPNMVQASAWLPWVLLCLDRLLRRPGVGPALTLGAVLGLQLLAAHVQMTLLTLYLAAAYGAWVVWRRKRTHPGSFLTGPPETEGRGVPDDAPAPHSFPDSSPPRLGEGGEERTGRGFQTACFLLLSLIVASGLAMGQLLPTLALFRDAARHHLSFAVVDRFYLPVNQLGNFVLPHLYGNPYFGDWTARGNAWETCCYVGGVSFGLALWGGVCAFRQNSHAAKFWVGVFAVSLWMALGGRGGLYHLAYFGLPGFRAFHDPARCLLPACFALSLLAAFGMGQVPSLGRRGWLTAGIVVLTFADLAHFGRTLYPLTDPSALLPVSPNIARVQRDPDIRNYQARVIAPTNGVWLRFTSPKDFRQDNPNYQTLWADTLTPNSMMPYGLRDAFGYEPVALKTTETAAVKAVRAFDPKASQADRDRAAALCGALGAKYVATVRVAPPEPAVPGLVPVRAAPTLAPAGSKRSPAAFVYLSRNLKWQARAHLEHSSAPVHLAEDGPDRLTLTFQTSQPDRLALEDAQAAGWSASLDGHTVPITTYQSCLRAVAVPSAGAHTVMFTYAPTPFRLGLYVSLLTLSGLLGAASFAWARKIGAREGIRRVPAE